MKKIIMISLMAYFFGVTVAEATSFTITSILTGDVRSDSPDNLIVNVTITGDTTSNLTSWVVDINSPIHNDVKLDEFYFNLALGAGVTLTFSNFSPIDWVISNNVTVQGFGSTNFSFEAYDSNLGGNGTNKGAFVNNENNLIFTAALNSGLWTEDMFILAPLSVSTAVPNLTFQLGAHLQSLTMATGDATDSGFATGIYSNPGAAVPEPATMLLFGTGLVGLAGIARRKVR